MKKNSREFRTQIDKNSFKRVLGIGDLFAVGYGDLGSSIYYALGITAIFSLGATPISLALAGMVFAFTALSYAELSSMVKETGGSATFARYAFNDLVSFIAGWALLLDFIVTISISSYSIAPYLSFFFKPLKQVEFKIGATILIICSLFLLNFRGVKGSARVSWFLTTLTLCTQVVVIIIGSVWLVNIPDLLDHLRIGTHSTWSPTWDQFWKGTAMAMVAYTGIESMAQLSSEAKSPKKTVPKAMMMAMGMLLFVYIGLSIVALSAVDPKTLSTEYLEDPIAGIVNAFGFKSKFLGGWIGILAAIILYVASNAGLIGASRLSFNMGENYQVPHYVYRLHPRYKSPYVSLAIFSLLAILIVIGSRGKLTFLADLYNFGAMLAFFMTHLSLIILRIRKPEDKRYFRVPFNFRIKNISIPITGVLGGIATFATWVLVLINKPDGRYLGIIWLTLGLLMYFFYRKKQELRPMGKVKIEKIEVPEYQANSYQKILVPTRGGKETQTVQMACEIAKVHGAKVTALHVIEIPFSLTLNASLPYRMQVAESILKRAEAIGLEFNIKVDLQIIKARSLSRAITYLVKKGGYDLLVMGTTLTKQGTSKGHGNHLEKILKSAICPVMLCFSAARPLKRQS